MLGITILVLTYAIGIIVTFRENRSITAKNSIMGLSKMGLSIILLLTILLSVGIFNEIEKQKDSQKLLSLVMDTNKRIKNNDLITAQRNLEKIEKNLGGGGGSTSW